MLHLHRLHREQRGAGGRPRLPAATWTAITAPGIGLRTCASASDSLSRTRAGGASTTGQLAPSTATQVVSPSTTASTGRVAPSRVSSSPSAVRTAPARCALSADLHRGVRRPVTGHDDRQPLAVGADARPSARRPGRPTRQPVRAVQGSPACGRSSSRSSAAATTAAAGRVGTSSSSERSSSPVSSRPATHLGMGHQPAQERGVGRRRRAAVVAASARSSLASAVGPVRRRR